MFSKAIFVVVVTLKQYTLHNYICVYQRDNSRSISIGTLQGKIWIKKMNNLGLSKIALNYDLIK